MLSLELCKAILNKEKQKYTNEEVRELRDFLYFLAELQLENNK